MSDLVDQSPKFTRDNYNLQCNTYESGFIFDFWSCSAAQRDSEGNKFPGAYPAGFLKRWKLAFANTMNGITREDILHVCSGRIPTEEGLRLDLLDDYNPDYLSNAENFIEKFPELQNRFRWVMADPPYNKKASEKYYDLPLLNKAAMIKNMAAAVKIGGYIGFLDQITQAGKPKCLEKIALIGVTSIPNLDVRMFTVYRRKY